MTTRSRVVARRVLPPTAVAVTIVGLAFALLAPPDQLQGHLQKLMYVHVPTAWLAYVAFLLTLVGSVGWLWRRRPAYDRLAAAPAEGGGVFTGLALRRAMPERADRARRSAVFGILAFAMVPVVHFSVIWWRTLHQPPTVLRPGDPTIDHTMLLVLGINLLGFTLIGLWLLIQRMELAAQQEALDDAAVAGDRELAGASIEPPRLEGPRINV